jgi:ADP-ribose pyrophosphatase YjhB (NUDIX family)
MLKLRHRLAQRAYLAYSRLSRGMTLGVRAMLLKDGNVLLVKHSYVPGWYLPGGGVEAGETFAEALAREVEEETAAVLTAPAELFGLYRHPAPPRRDHIALYVCREWKAGEGQPRWPEIVGAELFPVASLPEDAAPSTRARIGEVVFGNPVVRDW